MSDLELEARKLAAEELGMCLDVPVYYEYEISMPRRYWRVSVYECSLDGKRKEVWSKSGSPRFWLKWRGKRMCRKLAKEHNKGAESRRVWV